MGARAKTRSDSRGLEWPEKERDELDEGELVKQQVHNWFRSGGGWRAREPALGML